MIDGEVTENELKDDARKKHCSHEKELQMARGCHE